MKMLKLAKKILFPRIPSKPLTKNQLNQRRQQFVKRFVSAHAEGNVALSRGHFRTSK